MARVIKLNTGCTMPLVGGMYMIISYFELLISAVYAFLNNFPLYDFANYICYFSHHDHELFVFAVGTFKIRGEDILNVLDTALKAGYRAIGNMFSIYVNIYLIKIRYFERYV